MRVRGGPPHILTRGVDLVGEWQGFGTLEVDRDVSLRVYEVCLVWDRGDEEIRMVIYLSNEEADQLIELLSRHRKAVGAAQ